MLQKYEAKRRLARSNEPPPKVGKGEGPLTFVIQKHAARRLHYDFRLELDGVLKSWAVPKGPSLNPEVKRLAVMVEDHPLGYAAFEGVIPEGEYGAGEVIVWDNGTYIPEYHDKLFSEDRSKAEEVMRDGLAKGKLVMTLQGEKLKGSWALVRMNRGENNWLLIKHRDEYAEPERDVLKQGKSVISSMSISEKKREHSNRYSRSKLNLADIEGARKAPFPKAISPMLATPIDALFSDPDWLFEPKLDGFRAIAFIHDGNVKLLSRRGLDDTAQFPELVEGLKKQTASEMVLDGEIVALDDKGKPCFQCLQNHLKAMRKSNLAKKDIPVPIVYYIFDILYLDGYDLCNVPLLQRKAILGQVLMNSERIRQIEYFEKDGKAVYKAAISQGMEGAIAKRKDSLYELGERSKNWLKAKATLSDEFIIGGFSQGAGNRSRTFGALLLGYYDDRNRLVYAGHVGTGFDEETLVDIRKRLDTISIEKCPFAEVPPLNAPTTWVKPELVVEVKFAQQTQEGYLRIPVFMRLRDDKEPDWVRRTEFVSLPAGKDPPKEKVKSHGTVDDILKQLENRRENFVLDVEGNKITLSNMDKELFPAIHGRKALTKRDLIIYLAKVSPYLLPHLQDRPITLSRYPNGINGEHFWQKHWGYHLPVFVDSAQLSEHKGEGEYLICNNLTTLLWLGQLTDIELHTWFSRISAKPDMPANSRKSPDSLTKYPDFVIFDIDPYIYSGKEKKGDEPELNRVAFTKTAKVALWLKGILDEIGLSAFVKTSGKTGLHIYVPIIRKLDYAAVRSSAETIGRFLLHKHPKEITTEWQVEKRTGKVFIDCNQNVRGKTLASIYSPRPTPEATVSTPLEWDEVTKVYPTDFTILTLHERLAKTSELWSGIDDAKKDLENLLKNDTN